nr:diacylglycerol kinase family protein [Veillonella denticariosi]
MSTLFDTIEVKFTTGEGDATRFAKNACDRGFDAVFCMGGDGTVNETVNGIAQGGLHLYVRIHPPRRNGQRHVPRIGHAAKSDAGYTPSRHQPDAQHRYRSL